MSTGRIAQECDVRIGTGTGTGTKLQTGILRVVFDDI